MFSDKIIIHQIRLFGSRIPHTSSIPIASTIDTHTRRHDKYTWPREFVT